MRISDWSSDVCSSDLTLTGRRYLARQREAERRALPGPAFGTDHSAMALDDALDRRQADAVAVELLLVVQALERTEQLAGIFGRERSEERRVGKECVSTCRSRWSPDH